MGELHRTRHCVYDLTYHLVFVVKYRRKCIDEEIGEYLIREAKRIIELKGGQLIEGNHDKDHIHLLLATSPNVNLSQFVATLKNTLSRLVKRDFGEKIRPYLSADSPFWTPSFYISTTGGANLDTVRTYIEEQGRPTKIYKKRKKTDNNF